MTDDCKELRTQPLGRDFMENGKIDVKRGLAAIPGNPVTALREKFGWNMATFALATGLSYASLISLERGIPSSVTPKVMKELTKLGAPKNLPDLYAEWKAKAAAEIRAMIMKGLETDPSKAAGSLEG